MKDTVSHYVPPHSPLTSTEPQVFSNNLTMPRWHPFDATGTRDVLTLATELRERNARYGAVGVCVRSGQAVTVVLENPCAF